MRRAAKVDATHSAIVAALRSAGASVQSLAAVGKGCPDILVGIGGSTGEALFLMEIKTGNKKPNPAQYDWHAAWATEVHVVRTPDEALRVIGAIA